MLFLSLKNKVHFFLCEDSISDLEQLFLQVIPHEKILLFHPIYNPICSLIDCIVKKMKDKLDFKRTN